MNVPCPKCHGAFKVPDEVMTRGVAHVVCQKCTFKFVIRLGDPGSAPPKEEPPPGAPLELEGVKTSGSTSATSGEIGGAKPKFIAAETTTSIRVDPEFQREIHKVRKQLGEPVEEPTPLRSLEEEPTPAVPAPEEEPTPAARPTAPVSEEPTPAEEPTPLAPPPDMAEEPTPLAPPPAMAEEPSPLAPPPARAEEPTPLAPPPDMAEEPTPAGGAAPAVAGADAPTQPADSALATQPTEEMPLPAPQGEADDGFEAFRPLNVVPTPPAGAEIYQPSQYAPVIPQTVAGQPVMAVHQVMPQHLAPPGGTPPYQHPLVLVITPQPEELQRMERELQEKAGQTAGRGMRALGLFMTFVLVVVLVFLLFVLYKNNWSLDLANFGEMVENAFGGGGPQEVADELRGLEVGDPDRPIVEQAKLKNGQRVLMVQGVVRNNDTRTRRFIYVEATVKDNHMRPVVVERAPAGNIFTADQLASMALLKLRSSLNPAGSDGSNAKVEPGQSVAFMIVVTKVPHDYTPAEYRVHTRVVQAELYNGP